MGEYSPQLALDAALFALADSTRREIIERLRRGPARVTDVAGPFQISLNSVSKHIRVLERAGLVRRRRAGREHILTFEPAALDQAAAWIEAQRAAWTSRLKAMDAALQEQANTNPEGDDDDD